jgi:hypothetical protein
MKTILTTILATLAVVALLAASTSIYINQIRGGGTGTFVLTSTNGVNSWAAPPTSPNFSDAEVPTGTINGSNTAFTFLHTPVGTSMELVRNGVVQQAGVDYTLAGAVATFTVAPVTGDTLQAWYRY